MLPGQADAVISSFTPMTAAHMDVDDAWFNRIVAMPKFRSDV